MAYIKVDNLTLGYEGRAVTEGISFNVNPGDYLCIVGENGVGKSTLMKSLLHLIKPMGGTIEYGDGLLESEIGYLPQQTLVQRDFPASVKEIVMSGCLPMLKHKFFYGSAEKERAALNMERMEISHLKNECYRNLSGGQQQRVLLARALCASEKLLVLDEPVSGLDPKVTVELYTLIKKLNEEGLTIIMVSHDMDAAMEYASHILHVAPEKTFFGTVDEYKSSKLRRTFE